jgi:hypothetical protein
MRTNEIYWEEFLDTYLETDSFESLLEHFNITPHEVFEILVDSGQIDETLLKELARYGE